MTIATFDHADRPEGERLAIVETTQIEHGRRIDGVERWIVRMVWGTLIGACTSTATLILFVVTHGKVQ